MPWMGSEGLTTITCPSDTQWCWDGPQSWPRIWGETLPLFPQTHGRCWLCPGRGRLTGEPGPLRATYEAPKTEDKTHAVTEGRGGSTILVTLAVIRSFGVGFGSLTRQTFNRMASSRTVCNEGKAPDRHRELSA